LGRAEYLRRKGQDKLSQELDIKARVERCETSLENVHIILIELRDKEELIQKSDAAILTVLSKLNDRLDTIEKIVSGRFRPQHDATIARRERCWSA
jgi:hypothetical protein